MLWCVSSARRVSALVLLFQDGMQISAHLRHGSEYPLPESLLVPFSPVLDGSFPLPGCMFPPPQTTTLAETTWYYFTLSNCTLGPCGEIRALALPGKVLQRHDSCFHLPKWYLQVFSFSAGGLHRERCLLLAKLASESSRLSSACMKNSAVLHRRAHLSPSGYRQ